MTNYKHFTIREFGDFSDIWYQGLLVTACCPNRSVKFKIDEGIWTESERLIIEQAQTEKKRWYHEA